MQRVLQPVAGGPHEVWLSHLEVSIVGFPVGLAIGWWMDRCRPGTPTRTGFGVRSLCRNSRRWATHPGRASSAPPIGTHRWSWSALIVVRAENPRVDMPGRIPLRPRSSTPESTGLPTHRSRLSPVPALRPGLVALRSADRVRGRLDAGSRGRFALLAYRPALDPSRGHRFRLHTVVGDFTRGRLAKLSEHGHRSR
jgi:hypothetical protein